MNESAGGVLLERKGKAIPRIGAEDRKVGGTNSGESGAWNLEAERMRSRAGSTGAWVKLKASQR